MSTELSASVDFPADAAATYALVTDPDYVTAVAAATGGQDIEVAVEPGAQGGAVVTSRRELPSRVPSYARGLVGDTLRMTEVRRYGPAAPDGARTGEVEVSFDGAPVRISGTLRLHPVGDESVVDVTAQVSASVPFVGGKIERFAADYVRAFLAKETEVARDRLA